MKKTIICLSMLVLMLAAPLSAQQTSTSKRALDSKAGGVKSLEKRVQQLEQAVTRDVESDKWYDIFQFSGLVEVEAGYGKVDYKDPATDDEKISDIDLATVELAVDAKVNQHVDGHVLFKWEEDELFVDEGFITLIGSEAMPGYLIAGRQYIPFGNYDSFFVTDPTTLVLGETNEGALVGGYRFGGEMVDLSLGVFNGKAKEVGSDDQISNFVASIVVGLSENLMFGASYTSNLAASDTLFEFTDRDGDEEPDPISSFVGGYSAFVTFGFLERFKLIGEYVSASDDFEAGELYEEETLLPAERKKYKPQAWNVEFGFEITDAMEIALRYGDSKDGGSTGTGVFVLPEKEYGAVFNWGFFENCNLALEYIRGEFEDDLVEADTFICQLAIEF